MHEGSRDVCVHTAPPCSSNSSALLPRVCACRTASHPCCPDTQIIAGPGAAAGDPAAAAAAGGACTLLHSLLRMSGVRPPAQACLLQQHCATPCCAAAASEALRWVASPLPCCAGAAAGPLAPAPAPPPAATAAAAAAPRAAAAGKQRSPLRVEPSTAFGVGSSARSFAGSWAPSAFPGSVAGKARFLAKCHPT